VTNSTKTKANKAPQPDRHQHHKLEPTKFPFTPAAGLDVGQITVKEETVITLIDIGCTTALVLGAIALYEPVKKLLRRLSPQVGELCKGKDATIEDWDRASLLYRVPSNTVGFLMLEYVVLWVSIGLAAQGFGGLYVDSFFWLWLSVIAGLDSMIGIIGVVGIVCATVYGVHQELPVLRIKTLAAIGLFGVMIGLGLRYH